MRSSTMAICFGGGAPLSERQRADLSPSPSAQSMTECSPMLELGVLAGGAARLVHRVLPGVGDHLAAGGVDRIDAQLVGEPDEVEQDVGDLLAGGGEDLRRRAAAL